MTGKAIASRPTSVQVKHAMEALADPEKAKILAWFFKTGKGQYGEGDVFIGVTVPAGRKVAAEFRSLPLKEIAKLLKSPVHEHRFIALAVVVLQFKRAKPQERQIIVDFYLSHTHRINNWDLVDLSARDVLGLHLTDKPRDILYHLAKSSDLWERRLAMVTTLAFIKAGELEDVYGIAEQLLDDKHDLIHKAVGWALRESGKVSRGELLTFLQRNYQRIPRTALRYAIEHLPAPQRKEILRGDFSSAVSEPSKKGKSPPETNSDELLNQW